MIAKPVIYITLAELVDTHQLLLDHRFQVAPGQSDSDPLFVAESRYLVYSKPGIHHKYSNNGCYPATPLGPFLVTRCADLASLLCLLNLSSASSDFLLTAMPGFWQQLSNFLKALNTPESQFS